MTKVIWLLATAGVLMVGVKSALATSGNPSALCQAQANGPAPYVEEFGTSNSSGANAQYECPIAQGTLSGSSQTVSSGWFNFLDDTTVDALWCEMFLTNTSGSQWYSAIRYSCATAGGCATATATSTGYGYLGWSGSSLPTGASFTLNGNSYAGYVCQFPKSHEAYVFAYGVN